MHVRLVTAALLVCGALASPLEAAYTTGTIIDNVAQEDGRTRLVVRFTGNAGEPPVIRATHIDGSTTGISLRRWAIEQRDALNAARALAGAPALQIGQVVDLSAITVNPPSAADLARAAWVARVERLARLIAMGPFPAGALTDEIAALRTAVNADFQAASPAVRASWLAGF